MVILKHLSDDKKLQFIKIFNSVSLTDSRAEVITLIQDMILKLQSKLHRQELTRIKQDMLRSNKKLKEINERFLSDPQKMVASSAAQSSKGYIGS